MLSRVMPSRMLPDSSGVTSVPSCRPGTRSLPPSSSRYLPSTGPGTAPASSPAPAPSAAAAARGVVATALGGAGAALGRARVFGGQPDRHRGHALGEVRASRAGDDVVAGLVRAAHAEEGFVADHERAEVQARLVGRRHHSLSTAISCFSDSTKISTGSSGSARRCAERCRATAVGIRAEGPDRAVSMAVGLDAFEDLLAVVQHGRGRSSCSGP